MTVKKLIKKYTKLIEENYETIFISQVISDLRLIRMKYELRKIKRLEKQGKL